MPGLYQCIQLRPWTPSSATAPSPTLQKAKETLGFQLNFLLHILSMDTSGENSDNPRQVTFQALPPYPSTLDWSLPGHQGSSFEQGSLMISDDRDLLFPFHCALGSYRGYRLLIEAFVPPFSGEKVAQRIEAPLWKGLLQVSYRQVLGPLSHSCSSPSSFQARQVLLRIFIWFSRIS